MRFDPRIAALFAPHAIALLACAAAFTLMQAHAQTRVNTPQFLSAVDQLHVFVPGPEQDGAAEPARDVFRHEWTVDSSLAPPLPGVAARSGKRSPKVSMVVEAGSSSYCVINGRRMQRGDRGDGFTVADIGRDSVTVIHSNGSREIYHVKAY